MLTIKIQALLHRNPLAVAMNRRHTGKNTTHTNRSKKRSAQKAQRADANAW